MSDKMKIASCLIGALCIVSISCTQSFAKENNMFGAVKVDNANISSPVQYALPSLSSPPKALPTDKLELDIPIGDERNLPSVNMNNPNADNVNDVSQAQKLRDAIINLESAQTDVRRELGQAQSVYDDANRRYKMVKNEKNLAKKNTNRIKKKLKGLEKSKKSIIKNMK
jgi:hypothetical protein